MYRSTKSADLRCWGLQTPAAGLQPLFMLYWATVAGLRGRTSIRYPLLDQQVCVLQVLSFSRTLA